MKIEFYNLRTNLNGFCRALGRKNARSDRVFLDLLFLLSTVEECIKAKEKAKK